MKKWYPACFTALQYAQWQRDARLAPPSKLDSYCADCTPEYKQEMVKANRCAWPCVQFKLVDGDLVGKRARGVRPKDNEKNNS